MLTMLFSNYFSVPEQDECIVFFPVFCLLLVLFGMLYLMGFQVGTFRITLIGTGVGIKIRLNHIWK